MISPPSPWFELPELRLIKPAAPFSDTPACNLIKPLTPSAELPVATKKDPDDEPEVWPVVKTKSPLLAKVLPVEFAVSNCNDPDPSWPRPERTITTPPLALLLFPPEMLKSPGSFSDGPTLR